MATKTFALNTQPHVADIGDSRLEFRPEVMGDEFLDAYGRLQGITKELKVDLADAENADLTDVRKASVALRVFLATLMLPESADAFARWEVRAGGEVVSSHLTPEDADAAADAVTGSTVVNAGLRLPDRVLMELMEWVVELYGGSRPPTSSNGSAQASPPPGKAGRGASRSRG